MAQSPPIRTKRLEIVNFSGIHLSERYVSWLSNPELMRFSEQRFRRHTIDSCRSYWQSFQETPNYFWAIEKTGGGRLHIGNINAYLDTGNRLADIGILIGETQYQKSGFGKEAWLGVCGFLFNEGVRKITAGTLACNEAMVRLARSAGMIEDGVRKRHYIFEGREEDIIHFAMFREQWTKLPGLD